VANRPTAKVGSGGSNGATHSPAAFIVPVRRARLRLPAANDNATPLSRRLLRFGFYTVMAGILAFLLLT